MGNYYEILDTKSDATQEEVNSQYLFLIQAWHPDKFSSEEQKEKAKNKVKEINKAYSILCDPEKRRKYDIELELNISGPPQNRTSSSKSQAAP